MGEDSQGCTGDRDFHELVENEWQDAADVEEDINEDALDIDQWPGSTTTFVYSYVATERKKSIACLNCYDCGFSG